MLGVRSGWRDLARFSTEAEAIAVRKKAEKEIGCHRNHCLTPTRGTHCLTPTWSIDPAGASIPLVHRSRWYIDPAGASIQRNILSRSELPCLLGYIANETRRAMSQIDSCMLTFAQESCAM